jgi:hypothetical protein
MSASTQRTASLRAAMSRSTWSYTDLWLASVALGGDVTQKTVAGIAAGNPVSAHDYAVLSAAVDDHFTVPGHVHPGRCWQEP